MKKHILGAVVFSFIFASFAFAFALFYEPPIPQIAEVKVNQAVAPRFEKYEKTSCFRSNRKGLSAEVLSSHYIANENKIISKIKFVWSGAGEPPKTVSSATMFSTIENENENSFGTMQLFEKPFQAANEKTVTVVTKVSDAKIKKQDNLYVVSSVFDSLDGEISSINKAASERKEVLTIH
jgi:hypothetical protein